VAFNNSGTTAGRISPDYNQTISASGSSGAISFSLSGGGANTSFSYSYSGTGSGSGSGTLNGSGAATVTISGLSAGSYTISVTFSDGHTRSASATAYPVAGTLLSTYCVSYDKYGTYADGSGGTYDALIQANSADCGYVAAPPTLGPYYIRRSPAYYWHTTVQTVEHTDEGEILWNDLIIELPGSTPTSFTSGGYTYTRGTLQTQSGSLRLGIGQQTWYSVSRTG
jgi:hypothetical protein